MAVKKKMYKMLFVELKTLFHHSNLEFALSFAELFLWFFRSNC